MLNLASPGDKVRLYVDSMTALYYIKKQGGTRSHVLAREAVELWTQSISRDFFLLSPHWISTDQNVMADFLSRDRMQHCELMLDRAVFRAIIDHFQVFPTMDAFASRDTAQLPRYVS